MCPQSLSCLSPGRESCPRVARLYTLPVGLGRGWGRAGEEGGRRRSCASMDVEEVKADSLLELGRRCGFGSPVKAPHLMSKS